MAGPWDPEARRDSTALTVVEIDPAAGGRPAYRVVDRMAWTGVKHVALQALPVRAEPTAIAQLPLLNISGSGTVKPNLMLLYDNSGSMSYHFTPDYVDDSSTCRAGATMASNVGNTA